MKLDVFREKFIIIVLLFLAKFLLIKVKVFLLLIDNNNSLFFLKRFRKKISKLGHFDKLSDIVFIIKILSILVLSKLILKIYHFFK